MKYPLFFYTLIIYYINHNLILFQPCLFLRHTVKQVAYIDVLTNLVIRARDDTSGKVRVSFPRLKDSGGKSSKHTMILYLGKKVAEKIGIHSNDKIKFYIALGEPRIWLLKKSNDDVGYKVLDLKRPSGKASDAYRIQMTWKDFTPDESEIPLRTVPHEIYEGGIKVDLQINK